jgi:thiosulfate/3-mercaptopyruvate sulfurtransferase
MACAPENPKEGALIEGSYLIEASELQSMIMRPSIKVIDFRGKAAYANEHIAGAISIGREDIEDDSYSYNGIMASAAQMETLFGRIGIESSDTLVVYDDNGLCNAARLWWILQNYNFMNVKLLHGGIEAWRKVQGGLRSEVPVLNETTFNFSEQPSMRHFISKEGVLKALADKVLIVDTRTADEYSGKRQKIGAARAGRIPGSIHLDWAEAIVYDGDKRLKPFHQLEKIYRELGAGKEDEIILYCHSGVRSAHTTFVLTQLLGYKNVRNYDGSWTEWSQFENLPSEYDGITLINQ